MEAAISKIDALNQNENEKKERWFGFGSFETVVLIIAIRITNYFKLILTIYFSLTYKNKYNSIWKSYPIKNFLNNVCKWFIFLILTKNGVWGSFQKLSLFLVARIPILKIDNLYTLHMIYTL